MSALSPSGAARWTRCPGSVGLERLFPPTKNEYAAEGTLAHAWAAHMLDPSQPEPSEPCSKANLAYVQDYVDFVNRETEGGLREIEFKVGVQPLTGEANAKGIIDCAALVNGTLKIIDFKFGQGVKVDATRNLQLGIYACAALPFFEMFDEIQEVELIIHQPRMDNISRWTVSIPTLDTFAAEIRQKAADALQYYNADPLPPESLKPSVDACRFCRAKAACPALRAQAAQATDFKPICDEKPLPIITAESLDPQKLSDGLKIADLLEPWIASVREEARNQMIEGVVIPDFKLVLGRPGNRKWANEEAAEEMLKVFKLKENERYDWKVISPTKAEKLFKAGRIGQRQWPKLQDLITRSEAAPVIAPQTDEREAWSPVAQATDFTPIND